MNPTHIPGANRVLGAPKDWDAERNGPCDPLPVIDSGEFFQSAWIPDPIELDCMRAGAPCVVTIWGRGLPPHSVSVMPKPGYVPADAYKAAHLALRNLLFMVRTSTAVSRSDDGQLIGAAMLAEKIVGEIAPLARREEGDKLAQETPLPPSPNLELLREVRRLLSNFVNGAAVSSDDIRAALQKIGEALEQ